MLRKMVAFGVTLCMWSFAYGQNLKAGFQKVNKVADIGLKGQVKTFKVTPYKTDDNFGKVEKSSRMDYWRGDVISIFDKQGFKVQSDRFDRQGQLTQRVIYKYNETGNRSSRDSYNASGKILLRHVYVYNPKGHPMACNGYDPNLGLVESFTYKTNEKGQIVDETCVKSTQPSCNNYKVTYEKDGKLSSVCVEGKVENSCEKYVYDKQGRISQIELHRQGTLRQKTTITYDEKGNEKSMVVFDANNTFVEEREYSYTYDDNGNWVQRIEYINKFPKLILEREITYH